MSQNNAAPRPAPKLPWFDAARAGDAEALGHHLASGQDVDARDGSGMTAALLATFGGRADCLRLLMAAECDIEAATSGQRLTPALLATLGGHDDCLTLLIAAGCDIEARDFNGCTPAMFAAVTGDCDRLATLIDAGCNIDAMTAGGASMDTAAHVDCARILSHERARRSALLAARSLDEATLAALKTKRPRKL